MGICICSHSPVPTQGLSLTQTPVAGGKKAHTYLNQPPKQTVAIFLLKWDTLELVKLAADSFEMGGNWKLKTVLKKMARCRRCCLHNSIRAVNLIVNICGVGMIIYSLWLLKKWQDGVADLPYVSYLPRPW